MNHTPGPWTAAGPTIWGPPDNAAPAGYALAHVLNPYMGAVGSADRVAANAALLAAAPAMLQALESVLFTLEQEGDASVIAPAYKGHLAAEIRAAIRAATGEA